MDQHPLHFYAEPIAVAFDHPPVLEKKPTCPDAFTWREVTYRVTALVKEWVDYRRRGRMARNMQPQHAAVATSRGSWGVGRFYFQVVVDTGQLFELYYDRAPKDTDTRKGSWVLVGEYSSTPTGPGNAG
ncbi:MAG TPA: DUF6504 family protein [Anaerolineaceae bacterium]|jgi:hypothetical protein